MQNRSNLGSAVHGQATETPADFFLASLEAYASRIMDCMLNSGMPEAQVRDAFLAAASTLYSAAGETANNQFGSQRASAGLSNRKH